VNYSPGLLAALVKGGALLHGERLGEAAHRDGEAVQEADVAKQHKTVAMPTLDEADLRLPLDIALLVRVSWMRAQTDGLVAGDGNPAADGVVWPSPPIS